MAYAIKVAVTDAGAAHFSIAAQKTMYGGKAIAAGDTVYVFASENAGGPGLIARGVVTEAIAHPRPKDAVRHTPRVSLEIRRIATARRRLGRAELKPFIGGEGPQAELAFRFYKQATDKIIALSDGASRWLEGHF